MGPDKQGMKGAAFGRALHFLPLRVSPFSDIRTTSSRTQVPPMTTATQSNKRHINLGARSSSIARPLVLLVEDHEDTRFLYKCLLAMRGYTVVEAVNGEEAIEVAERLGPDLILMDASLPRVDGITATRRIRDLAHLQKVPIIFTSGRAEPDAMSEAHAAGCNEYLVKPIDTDQLDNLLTHYLSDDHPFRLLRKKGRSGNGT
jgi:CheY-like chemotaxis protein